METSLVKKLAAVIFYGSLTLLPTLVWIVSNHYETISYTVLLLLTVMPLLVFYAVRGILEEAPNMTATTSMSPTINSGASFPG